MGNKIGLLGVGALIVGLVLTLWITANVQLLVVAGWVDASAFSSFILAGYLRPRKWLLMLLLLLPTYFLWLLAHGH